MKYQLIYSFYDVLSSNKKVFIPKCFTGKLKFYYIYYNVKYIKNRSKVKLPHGGPTGKSLIHCLILNTKFQHGGSTAKKFFMI